MGFFVANQVIKLMTKKDIPTKNANILIMGLAFKENCPDIRNTRVVDLVKEFRTFDCKVDVYDPWVNKDDAMKEYKIELIEQPKVNKYDAIIVAVAHNAFKDFSTKQIKAFGKDNHVLYDIKYLLREDEVDGRL